MDLCNAYVLKRHRKLPAGERPVFYLLSPTLEDAQRLREEVAQATGAASDGSSQGAQRKPAELSPDFVERMVARHLRRVERLHDAEGQEISLAGLDEASRLALVRRVFPVRVIGELSAAALGDLDQEEERISSGSEQP